MELVYFSEYPTFHTKTLTFHVFCNKDFKKRDSLLVSIVDNRLILHRNTLWTQAASCLPHCEYPNHCCHTDYLLYRSFDSQTWYTFLSSNSHLFKMYTPDIPICHFVYEYLMSLNVLTISFVSLWVRGPAHSKNAQCHFVVWAYRE